MHTTRCLTALGGTMTHYCRRIGLFALACVVGVLLIASGAIPAGLQEPVDLDGKVYAGTLLVVHTGALLNERLEFAAGQLQSSASDALGYTDGPYSARWVAGTIAFDAFTESPALGWMVWRGRIDGRELDGFAEAHDPGEPLIRFEVKAHLVD